MLRAALERDDVEVVAVNDPFVDACATLSPLQMCFNEHAALCTCLSAALCTYSVLFRYTSVFNVLVDMLLMLLHFESDEKVAVVMADVLRAGTTRRTC